jgi:putative transposase
LPHLDAFARHPLLFLTVCTDKRRQLLANPNAHALLAQLWSDSRRHNGWCVGRYVVMPDHIHLFARPDEKPVPLARWVAAWKSISARLIVANNSARPPIWQRDYFDRFIRTLESYDEKWDYVCNNPVRAGLVNKRDDWPFQGVIHDLSQ